MIKALVIALWACLILVGSQYGAHQIRDALTARAAGVGRVAMAVESRKTKEINIPRIKNGVIKGYVVAVLTYQVDLNALKTARLQPDAIVADETFRYVYDDTTIDFDHLDRFDLGAMTKALVKAVNARMKSEAVLDMGVQEFTFLASSETKQRM
jgi:hypothetical protein